MADGNVRCGECQQIFNATHHLIARDETSGDDSSQQLPANFPVEHQVTDTHHYDFSTAATVTTPELPAQAGQDLPDTHEDEEVHPQASQPDSLELLHTDYPGKNTVEGNDLYQEFPVIEDYAVTPDSDLPGPQDIKLEEDDFLDEGEPDDELSLEAEPDEITPETAQLNDELNDDQESQVEDKSSNPADEISEQLYDDLLHVHNRAEKQNFPAAEDETGPEQVHDTITVSEQREKEPVLEKSTTTEADQGADYKSIIRDHLPAHDDNTLEQVSDDNVEQIAPEPLMLDDNKSSYRAVWLTLCSGFLLCLLAVQYIYFNIETLATHQRYGHLFNRLCLAIKQCAVAESDITSLYTDRILIRSHPSIDQALEVNFLFRNDDSVAQLLPLAELNFTDIDDQPIAGRIFTPEEYLPQSTANLTHVPANSSIQATFSILDPGQDAVNFSLVLHKP